jgi:hypothetical protein
MFRRCGLKVGKIARAGIFDDFAHVAFWSFGPGPNGFWLDPELIKLPRQPILSDHRRLLASPHGRSGMATSAPTSASLEIRSTALRDSTKDGQWAIVLPKVGDRREAGDRRPLATSVRHCAGCRAQVAGSTLIEVAAKIDLQQC